MSHLEKLEALLDEMGVFYERVEHREKIYITVPGKTEGYKNRGPGESMATFDTSGNCLEYWVAIY